MNTTMDLTEPEGPEIQSTLILEFLIKRFNESLTSDDPKVPFLLQGIGLMGLGTDEELLSNYKGLLASPHLPPPEVIRRSIDILQIALERDPDGGSSQRHPQEVEGDHPLDEKACRHIMMHALREGKIMIEQTDYRYSKIFESLGWISLQSDPEWLAEFEAVRRRFATDPGALIDAGRDILRDALFRRRPSGRVLPPPNM